MSSIESSEDQSVQKFEIRLTGTPVLPATVQVATASSTATSNFFTPKSSTFVFNQANQVFTFEVPILDTQRTNTDRVNEVVATILNSEGAPMTCG